MPRHERLHPRGELIRSAPLRHAPLPFPVLKGTLSTTIILIQLIHLQAVHSNLSITDQTQVVEDRSRTSTTLDTRRKGSTPLHSYYHGLYVRFPPPHPKVADLFQPTHSQTDRNTISTPTLSNPTPPATLSNTRTILPFP